MDSPSTPSSIHTPINEHPHHPHHYNSSTSTNPRHISSQNASISSHLTNLAEATTTSMTTNANINGKTRYAQILEMSNHQICTEKNQRALLEAKMNQLSSLVHEIQETDWMFEKKRDGSGSGSGDGGGGLGSEYSGGNNYSRPVGFHRGLPERW